VDAQLFPPRRVDSGPKPKNIQGVVTDLRGKPLLGARVFIRDMKSNVVRTMTTDQQGRYSQFALTPTVDYEVTAEYRGKVSEKRVVSSFVNRQDNVLNFQLDVAVIEGAVIEADDAGPEFRTFDLVELHGSFDLPVGIPAPVPAVLLLHGYGEDRTAWKDFQAELLKRGWAVMTVDLRGHGESKTRNRQPIQASTEWRTNPREFPLDVDPSLDWLKAQPRIDTQKIVVIGFDVGANLALLASGKFPEVRTIVAIKPSLTESLALAGSAQDFTPRSALIITSDEAGGNRVKESVRAPSRVLMTSVSGGVKALLADRQIQDAIFQWLKETY